MAELPAAGAPAEPVGPEAVERGESEQAESERREAELDPRGEISPARLDAALQRLRDENPVGEDDPPT